mgnify:CR=1 FL=1|jgi:hypothetical protein
MKVWLLVLFLHTPEMPSIKYSAELYANDFDCIERQAAALNAFEQRSKEYKDRTKFDAHCIEFDSFPIPYLLGT